MRKEWLTSTDEISIGETLILASDIAENKNRRFVVTEIHVEGKVSVDEINVDGKFVRKWVKYDISTFKKMKNNLLEQSIEL